MIDEEEAEEGEDKEPKAEAFSLKEGMGAEENTATKEDAVTERDVAVEEETHWERHLYHTPGNKEYVVRGEGVSKDFGVVNDDATEVPAVDSPTIISTTLTAQPSKSLAMVHTWVISGGYSFPPMADIIFDGRNGSTMIICKPYRSSGEDSPEVRTYLNGSGVYHYYESSWP